MLKTPILGRIAWLPKWGCPVTPAPVAGARRRGRPGPRSAHPSCLRHPRPFPETFPEAPPPRPILLTTKSLVHNAELGLPRGGDFKTSLSQKLSVWGWGFAAKALGGPKVWGVWLRENAGRVITQKLTQQPCPKLDQNKSCAISEAPVQDFRNAFRSYLNLADGLTFLRTAP